jgi:hypothetical protein
MLLQLSVAVAPPWLLNHEEKVLLQLEAPQATFAPLACLVIVRAPAPVTVNVADVVAELPQLSLAVNFTVTEPQPFGADTVQLLDQLTVALSVATAPPWLFNHVVNAPLTDEPQETVWLLAGVVILRPVLPVVQLNWAEQVEELPHSSVQVNITVLEPQGEQVWPLQLFDHVTL